MERMTKTMLLQTNLKMPTINLPLMIRNKKNRKKRRKLVNLMAATPIKRIRKVM